MTQDAASRIDPEPIDAEFEPASDAGPAETPRTRPPPRLRSRTVRLPELVIGCAVSTFLGAVIAIALSGDNSGAATGTLAREIDALAQQQRQLSDGFQRTSDDLVSIRARLDTHATRLSQRESASMAIRSELAVIAGQMAALVTENPNAAAPAADASATALGVLLARIDALEATLAEDAAAPKTTRQTQRAVTDLVEQIAALKEANTQLAAALASRQAALSTLEAGLARVSAELNVVRGRQRETQQRISLTAVRSPFTSVSNTGGQPEAPGFAPGGVSRTASAFHALRTAAQGGRPFVSHLQVLAGLMPSDTDIASLRDIARYGAPTRDQLERDFRASSHAAGIIMGQEAARDWDWLRAALPPALTANTGPADLRPSSILAQARDALDAGDIRGAAQALDGLQGLWGNVFHDWRDQAMRRADLDDRLASLNNRISTADTSLLRD